MRTLLALALLLCAGVALAYNPFMPQGRDLLVDMDRVWSFELVGTPASGTITLVWTDGDSLTVPTALNADIIEWVQKRTIENRETSEWAALGPKKAVNLVSSRAINFKGNGDVDVYQPFGVITYTGAEAESLRAKPWVQNIILSQ